MRFTGSTLCMVALAFTFSGYSTGSDDDPGSAQRSAAEGRAEAVIAGDYFAAGAASGPDTPVQGDAFITGAEVNLRSPVDGDAMLAGARVNVAAGIGSDLYAAGGRVLVDAAVGHNARLAGGRVRVTRHGDIAGKVTVAARKVRLEGRVGGALVVFGDEVIIDGEINGGAAVVARVLQVGPAARIDGRLTYRTAEAPEISSLAIISEGVRQSVLEFPGEKLQPLAGAAIWVGVAMFTCGLFLVGMLIVVLAPYGSASIVRQLRLHPFASLLLGVGVTICVPVAAIVALLTVIGIPLGLLLLFLWPSIAVLGYLSGVIFVGDSIASLFSRLPGHVAGRGMRVLGLAIALLALLLVSCLFWVGAVAILLLLFCGSGALLIGMRNALR